MPVLPQININQGRADVPGTQDLAQAFEAQIIAEREQESPVTSLTRGVEAVQGVVQNQQAIESNEQTIAGQELENERKKLANALKRETDTEDLELTRSLQTGDLNEQLNVLLSADPVVLQRNGDAVTAVAERIRTRGTEAQKQMIDEEIMPIVDRERVMRERAAEERDQDARERIRLASRETEERQRRNAARSRKDPDLLEMERQKKELELREQRADTVQAERKAGIGTNSQDRLQQIEQETKDLSKFLSSKGQIRESQALQTQINRAKQRAEIAGEDPVQSLQEVNERFIKALDRRRKNEFLTREVKSPAQIAAERDAEKRTINAPRGRSLLGVVKDTVVNADLEARVLSTGKITKEQLEQVIDQEMANVKAKARAENLTLEVGDAALREVVKREVLLQLEE